MALKIRVEIDGQEPLENTDLEHLEVVQRLSAHCGCAFGFSYDRTGAIALEDLVGRDVVVTITESDGGQPAFTGFTTGGAHRPHIHGGGSSFTLEAISHSAKLEYRNTAYHADGTIESLADSLGARLVGSPSIERELDYVQYGESDFQFLLRVAEEHGLFLLAVDEEPELHSEFSGDTATLTWGENLSALTLIGRPVNTGFKGAFYDWREKSEYRFHGVQSTPDWLGGASGLVGRMEELAQTYGSGGDAQVEEFMARSRDHADYREALEHKSARLLGNSVRVEGASVAPELRVGRICELADDADERLPPGITGRLGLAQVVHLWDGESYTNRFVATPWAGFTSSDRPPRRLALGPVSAVVVDNEDPEGLGRLQVRHRWQEEGDRTRWLRVVAPYAGHQRGLEFLPEVGDEVVVGFEQGDPERPLVLGATWSGKDEAPARRGGNEEKVIVTRSGNTVRFVDEDGKETIELHTAGGTCLVQLTNDHQGKPLVTVRSGGDMSLEAEGELRLKCEKLTQRVSGDAGRFVGGDDTVDAGGDGLYRAGGKRSVEGSEAVLKASGNITAQAGGVSNLAGGTVQIQPPGLFVPPTNISRPPEDPTAWSEQDVPEAAPELDSSGDSPRGRSS